MKTPVLPVDWLLEALALAGLLFLAGYALYHYGKLPDTIPSHFNATGEADDFSGKGSFWFLPGVALFVYVLLTFISRIPHRFNYLVEITPKNAAVQYRLAVRMLRVLKLVLLVIFLLIIHGVVRSATGQSSGLGLWFLPVFFGLVFIPMIVYFVLAAKNR